MDTRKRGEANQSQRPSGTHEFGPGATRAALGDEVMIPAVSFASVLTRFFTQRLIQQRRASSHTVASYRDTFRLLLRFRKARTGKAPSSLAWQDIDAPLISAYLDDLEELRGITPRTRNLRLTAIRSLFKYAAFELPEHAEQIQRVLAIPSKRCTHPQIGYLNRPEVDALLAAPDKAASAGRRDYALILLAVQSGLRLSELTGLRRDDIFLGAGAHVRVMGKGRKERCTPLTKQTVAVLQAWLLEPARGDGFVVFPARGGGRLSSDGVQYLLARHVAVAGQACASLPSKKRVATRAQAHHGNGSLAGWSRHDSHRDVAWP